MDTGPIGTSAPSTYLVVRLTDRSCMATDCGNVALMPSIGVTGEATRCGFESTSFAR